MTSSATPNSEKAPATDAAPGAAADPDEPGAVEAGPVEPPGPDLAARLRAWPAEHLDVVALGVLAVAGWFLVGHINRWYVGAPLLMLSLGWLAILIGGRFLWRSAEAAAREGEAAVDDDGFAGRSRREDLEAEKRSLLKAIKEVEFDREMGKLSAADAADIIRLYRGRAIELLKELEDPEGRPLDAAAQVERELKARLLIAKVGARKKPAADRPTAEAANAAKAAKAEAPASEAAASPASEAAASPASEAAASPAAAPAAPQPEPKSEDAP